MKKRPRAGVTTISRTHTLSQRITYAVVLLVMLVTTVMGTFPFAPKLPAADARFLETRMVPGQMTTTREAFSANLITTGIHKGKVLIAGGFDGTNYLNSAELYNPQDGRFTLLSGGGKSLTTPRAFHKTVALSDGKILFVGGQNAAGTAVNTLEVYNPVSQNFETYYNLPTNPLPTMTETAKNMSVTKYTVGADDFIVIAGGEDAAGVLRNKVYVYDVTNNVLTEATGTLATARTEHNAMFYPNAGTQG